MSTILDKIIDAKRSRLGALKREVSLDEMVERATIVRDQAVEHRLRTSLVADGPNIIAEIKRASPSKGVIRTDVDVAVIARQYADGGASAISVLTEEDFFSGSLDDLIAVRAAVDLPILRKDFIIDEYQVYESAAAGADAVLLIVAALGEDQIVPLLDLARNELGMDVIVEVHSSEEFEVAERVGADIIGVNNRNLKTFEISLDVSRQIIDRRPVNTLFIAESGISDPKQIAELGKLGYDGFLIGETLMRSGDPQSKLRDLATEITEDVF